MLVIGTVALFASDFFFCLAHWVFAIQYFAMSRNLPLLLANQDITANEIKYKQIKRYFIMCIFLVVFTCMVLYFTFYFQQLKHHKLDDKSVLFVAAFQLILLVNIVIYLVMMAALSAIVSLLK
jgi:hypothetical protein